MIVIIVQVIVVAVLGLWPWCLFFGDGDVALPCWCCTRVVAMVLVVW